SLQRFSRSQKLVELCQRNEEVLNFLVPRQRLRVVPCLLSPGHGERPIHEIADVCENLRGRAHAFVSTEVGKAVRRIADSFFSAISKCGQSVAQQFAFWI